MQKKQHHQHYYLLLVCLHRPPYVQLCDFVRIWCGRGGCAGCTTATASATATESRLHIFGLPAAQSQV